MNSAHITRNAGKIILLLGLSISSAHAQRPESLSLKSFAEWLRTISKSINEKAATTGSVPVEASQLKNLYDILNTLQRKRGAYIESIDLLIDAKEQHLPKDASQARGKVVISNAGDLYNELMVLDTAVAPMELDLDLNHPNVLHLKQYQQRQEAQVKQIKDPEMMGSFTTKNLKTISQDAKNNGTVLQQAIDELAQTIRALQPSAR